MINIAILGMDLRSRVRAGENAGRTLTHDFVALATAAAPMTADEGRFAASTPLPEVASGAGRHALVTWDAVAEAWVKPEAFWVSYANRGEGRHWSGGSDYPPYAEVGEHDTFLLQTQRGPCLMYFFHRRWRRANDVRRWGDEFNDYGGCPDVFN